EGEVAGGESVEVAPAPEGAAPTSDGEVADGETAVLDAGAQPSTSEPASEFADDAMDAPAPATATGSEDAEAEITDADSTEAEATASAELDGEPAPAAPSPTHVAGADADADADVGGRPDTAARSAVRATADTAAPSAPTAEPDAPAPSRAPTTVADAMFDADLESLEGDDPWQQVARVVRPLRQLADGSQRIALQLRPAELGSVHLEVALEDGGLNMRAVTETVAARDALVGALPELRAELARSGIGVGSLEVGEDTMAGDAAGNGPGGDETAGRDTRARTATDGLGGASPAATSVPVPQPTPVVAAGRLDLTL
ncbi:MAG: flagellar hook-length control protein FliK, partial [Acidimicrobiales bacterium]